MKQPATLMGLAIGDALGAPFEFSNDTMIKGEDWHGEFRATTLWDKRLEAGQWTDDTKMAICIAQSIAELGEYSQEDVSQKYVSWVNSGDLRGIGNQTGRAIHNMIQGVDLDECGKIAHGKSGRLTFKRNGFKMDRCGNGTVMRVAPIGLFYKDDLVDRIKFAQMDAKLTHDHKDAVQGNIVITELVSLLANGKFPNEAVDDVISMISDGNVREKLEAARAYADKSRKWSEVMDKLGTSGAADETVGSAVFCLLRYCQEGFKVALCSSISMGGDTDSRGAVVGALMGSYVGYEGIPEDYLDEVEHSNVLRALDRLLLLGPNKLQKELNQLHGSEDTN